METEVDLHRIDLHLQGAGKVHHLKYTHTHTHTCLTSSVLAGLYGFEGAVSVLAGFYGFEGLVAC